MVFFYGKQNLCYVNKVEVGFVVHAVMISNSLLIELCSIEPRNFWGSRAGQWVYNWSHSYSECELYFFFNIFIKSLSNPTSSCIWLFILFPASISKYYLRYQTHSLALELKLMEMSYWLWKIAKLWNFHWSRTSCHKISCVS